PSPAIYTLSLHDALPILNTMKMRRINFIRILLAAGVVFGLNACDNDYESVFQETPDERVEQALGEFENLLISAPFGWKASLHTQDRKSTRLNSSHVKISY